MRTFAARSRAHDLIRASRGEPPQRAKQHRAQDEEGKERARRNALRHGLAAEHILLIDEDAEDFTEFAAGMRRALGPVGAAETVLADRIVMANWRLRRVWRQEAAALNAEAIHIAHGHARDELYERILAGLKENPPEQLPDREMPWQPPHTLSSIARAMVNGMSDAQVEEAVTSKERAGADAALDGEPGAVPRSERKPQKPDTPIWPEARMAALSRYEGSIERALHRASTALEKLQARRREDPHVRIAPPHPPASRRLSPSPPLGAERRCGG